MKRRPLPDDLAQFVVETNEKDNRDHRDSKWHVSNREVLFAAETLFHVLTEDGHPDPEGAIRRTFEAPFDPRPKITECVVCGDEMQGHPDDPPVCSHTCESEFFDH